MSRSGKILFFLAGLSLVSFAVVRFLLGGWVPFLWFALGFTALFIFGGFFVDRSFFKEFLSLKTTKKGMSMGAMILMALVTLGSLNFLGSRHYLTWDLSLNKMNTLSDQSVQLAKSLKSDLRVIYFYQEGAEGVTQTKGLFIQLLRKYQDVNSRIQLDFIEVNERPDLAKEYGIERGTQSVVLEYEGRRNTIEKIEEQELTGALAKVTREKEKKIRVLSGHGQVGLNPSQDGRSLSVFKNLLEGNRYQVESFSFTQATQLPEDTDVLVIVGPKQQFLDFEIQAIEHYLIKGGSLFLALESGSSTGLESLLGKIGLKLDQNVVVTVIETPLGRGIDPRFTRGVEFSTTSTVTKPFGRNEVTVFRMPQSLSRTGGDIPSLEWTELVKTNTQSIGYQDLNFKAEGQKGPFTLAYEVKGVFPSSSQENSKGGDSPSEDPSSKSGVSFHGVILGDEDIVSNQLLYQNLNRDLVLNAVSALAKEENLISISPKEIQSTRLEMTETGFILFIFGLVIPLPLLLYGLSGFFWFRRRNA
jgi:ABC-type uncharacterized transport system involved in gliding motility auxiliary subunit